MTEPDHIRAMIEDRTPDRILLALAVAIVMMIGLAAWLAAELGAKRLAMHAIAPPAGVDLSRWESRMALPECNESARGYVFKAIDQKGGPVAVLVCQGTAAGPRWVQVATHLPPTSEHP